MHISAKSTLLKYSQEYAVAGDALMLWNSDAKHATWESPNDVKAYSASASIIEGNRVVFNIRGNEYRLIVAVAYRYEAVYIKFVGTHAQYDTIDAASVDQE